MQLPKGLTRYDVASCAGRRCDATGEKMASLQGWLPYPSHGLRPLGQARVPEAANSMHMSGTTGEYALAFLACRAGNLTGVRGDVWAGIIAKKA